MASIRGDLNIDAFRWRNLSPDLKIVYFWLGLATAGIFLPGLTTGPFRIIVALPVVLFIPGYCLIAALFPTGRDIDGIERFALSMGLSIIVVSLIGLALNFTPWGIQLTPVVISLVIFTVILVQIAQYRRFSEPEEKRFRVSFSDSLREAKKIFPDQKGTPLTLAINALIVVMLIAATGMTVYVIAVPKAEEGFTDFYIIGENGKAADYPKDLAGGFAAPVIIGIQNHEYRDVTYTVEIWLTTMTFNASTNATDAGRMEILDRFSVNLLPNETYQAHHSFTPAGADFNQVTFLLFKDAIPPDLLTGNERISSSYRKLHLWVTVKPPSE